VLPLEDGLGSDPDSIVLLNSGKSWQKPVSLCRSSCTLHAKRRKDDFVYLIYNYYETMDDVSGT
jgi:hypothetical protein